MTDGSEQSNQPLRQRPAPPPRHQRLCHLADDARQDGVGANTDTGLARVTREIVSEESNAYPVIASFADGVLVVATTGPTAESVLRVARLPAR